MLAAGKGEIVRELRGLGLSDAGLVAANRGEAGAGAEIEGGKCMSERMLADVHAFEAQLLECARAWNGEIDAGGDIGEAVTKLVQQPRADGVGVGNEQAAVVNAVNIIRQERVREIGGYVLAAEAAVDGLLEPMV